MSAFHNNALIGSSNQGYTISRSVRLRASATAYFSRTNSNAPTNNKIGTLSMWLKRGALTNGTGNNQYVIETGAGSGGTVTDGTNFTFYFDSTTDKLIMGQYSWAGYSTTQVYRDPSAWYHIVISYNSTLASNNVSLYVNNVLQGTTSVVQNTNWAILNSGQEIDIGRHVSVNRPFDGYLTEINVIDGQALTPNSFGTINSYGVWQPIKYTGTYGTNGFYLNFSDNSNNTATTIGKDYSGNGNNWTPNNISVTAGVTYDSMLDVPTPYTDGGNGRGNYCTLNPLYKGTNVTATEGNLKFGMTAGNYHEGITGTIFPTSGKWYAEFRWNAVTVNTTATAVCRNNAAMNNITCAFQNTVDTNSPTYRSYIVNGNKDTNTTSAAYGSTYTANDTIGVALDLDNGKVWFSKNGAWQASGDPAAGTNAAFTDITGSDGWTFGVSGYGSGGDNCHANFGQQPFTYTPPTGFNALNTQNLPDSTIKNGAAYMAATLYTGNGATQSITNTVNGTSFQPDFVWIKVRSASATDHYLADAVRGATKFLQSDTTAAEGTNNGLTAFNSNGFSVGAIGDTNSNAATLVGWQWNAGGSTVTNTSGTISSQVRASTTAGFSVVTYTGNGSAGATFGHGLGVTPAMIIIKARTSTSAENWFVYQQKLTAVTYYLRLNSTNAQTDGGSSGATSRVTAISSSVITLGPNAEVNESTKTYVAYCFAAVAGYSAFGSYTGNGSTDGPFVYCGFRPRWVMIKSTTAARDWLLYDTARATYNVLSEGPLQPNTSGTPYGAGYLGLDILSNGFKLRETTTNMNASAETHIYAAFAENPFKLSLAR